MLCNWPIAFALPALVGEKYPSVVPTTKRLAQALHRLGYYNLLQVARQALADATQLKPACDNDDELKLLCGYAQCLSLEMGSEIWVTWKSENPGEGDSTYSCIVVSSVKNGSEYDVQCDGNVYTISVYLDEIMCDNVKLLQAFDATYSVDVVSKVEMINAQDKNVYCGYFDENGLLEGVCTIKMHDSDNSVQATYNHGMLVE